MLVLHGLKSNQWNLFKSKGSVAEIKATLTKVQDDIIDIVCNIEELKDKNSDKSSAKELASPPLSTSHEDPDTIHTIDIEIHAPPPTPANHNLDESATSIDHFVEEVESTETGFNSQDQSLNYQNPTIQLDQLMHKLKIVMQF